MPFGRRFFVTFGEHRLKIFQKLAQSQRIEGKSLNANILLAAALESQYNNCLLSEGTVTTEGFYQDAFILQNDSFIKSRLQLNPSILMDSARIENDLAELMYLPHHFTTPEEAKSLPKLILKIGRSLSSIECIRVAKSQAMELFLYSPLKLYHISKIPENQDVIVIKHGSFIDLWKDPGIPMPNPISSALITNMGASQISTKHPQNMNRIHAVAFATTQELKDYKLFQEEASRRNHKRIGQLQSLFTFHHYSPGGPFFLPHGTRILSSLKSYLCQQYKHFGFEEVITPLIFDKKLWETSGHWQNYKDDMFLIPSDEQTNAIKPMNCPGHCLLYGTSGKSYRDLPLRFAEFSPLHRNEASGALSGLTRVTKFHQDDGHIFCRPNQIRQEIKSSLEFIKRVYTRLGFANFEMSLSTRPELFMGEEKEWEDAENALKLALDDTKQSWSIKHGDGAFYGPKIDITLKDALNRSHQTATIQLDFQLPTRFGLNYMDEEGKPAKPVIIHRAVLGSLERMLAILIENYAGKWPFWLSPRHAIIIPTRKELIEEGEKCLAGFSYYHVDLDRTDNTLAKKVRDAQKLSYNYIFILGDREVTNGTLMVRSRSGIPAEKEMDIPSILTMFKSELSNPQ